MARILISYFRSDELTAGATLAFWDGLFLALKNCGNDVLAINNAYYGIYTTNTTYNSRISTYLHNEVRQFNPDIIITFNNRILQSLLSYYDGPIIIYDGDELKFFSDLPTLKRDRDRYVIFSIVKKWYNDYIDFGFNANQIFYMPPGTEIRANPLVTPNANISFLGQRRFFLSDKLIKDISNGKNIEILYNTYLEHLKTGSYDYEALYLKNGGQFSDQSYKDEDLWPLFDDSYLIFANLVDLGLHLGGHEGGWRDIVEYIPQIAVTHSKRRIFTLDENEYFYNASKISLNPMHPQSRGAGFSWRSLDIMASNACLVSSYSSELKDLTRGEVEIPMFRSPAEARQICEHFLLNEQDRLSVVRESQNYVEQNCRWVHRFKEMEEILGINLVADDGRKGTIKKLAQVDSQEFANQSNPIFIISNRKPIHANRIPPKEKITQFGNTALHFYEKYHNLVLRKKSLVMYFGLSYLMLLQNLCVLYIQHNNFEWLASISNILMDFFLLYLLCGGVFISIALLFRPIRKLCHYFKIHLWKQKYK